MSWLLDLHDLARSFGSYEALRGVTLQLPPGRIGLLGPNGAGKSTLLKILMGLLAPTRGHGTILQQPIGGEHHHLNNWNLRRLIGLMPEAEALVPGLTGLAYVSLAGELYGMPRRQAQRRAHEVLSYLELDEARYRRVEDYSAGMKQRVKLAQALVHDPPVLLLDEPTSGLDPAGRDTMLKLIVELGTEHGKSILLSTHLLADVTQACEQVVFLMNGAVKRVGQVAELMTQQKQQYKVRVQAESEAWQECFRQANIGLQANLDGTHTLSLPVGMTTQKLFQLLQPIENCQLHSLLPVQKTLEGLFLEMAEEAAG